MTAIPVAGPVPGVSNNISGTGADEQLRGAGKSDTVAGNGGDDTIKGRNGHDDLDGGAGNDTLDGGNGADTLHGGTGDNILIGGNGSDSFRFDGNLAGLSFDTVMDFDVGRKMSAMTFEDKIELVNVGGKAVRYQQNGDNVELYVDNVLMALFKGSQGALSAQDLLAATIVTGAAPVSLAVGFPPADPIGAVLIKGAHAYDYSGNSVASAGDVDGDGLDDVIIGAYGAANYAGESYLLYGSALAASGGMIDLATLTPDQGVLIRGSDISDYSGFSVASAGDVDGDGLNDVVIGAFGNSNFAGLSYLVYGAALVASGGTLNLATLTPDQGVLIRGINAYEYSGRSVASAGDVDGDGLDDLLIGAPSGANHAGESFLVYGAALVASGGTIDLATLTADQGVLIKGIDAFDTSGNSVASAGDVDGDGLNDVIIGAYGASGYAGESYLVYGAALAASGGTIDLATLTPDQGVLIRGIDAHDSSGNSVASAGDVDGDGLGDIIIGAHGGANYAGESYLVYGSALAASGGTIDLATLTPDQGVLIQGAEADGYSGYSVSSAGDVDGDGLGDIVIGAFNATAGPINNAGASYLVYGSALAASGGTIDLATLTPDQGVVIRGIDQYDNSGYSVASAGDVDGDGFDDLIIGAFSASPDGRSNAGESYVISGALLAAEKLGDGVYDLPDFLI